MGLGVHHAGRRPTSSNGRPSSRAPRAQPTADLVAEARAAIADMDTVSSAGLAAASRLRAELDEWRELAQRAARRAADAEARVVAAEERAQRAEAKLSSMQHDLVALGRKLRPPATTRLNARSVA
jgi:2,4-dienoyl-CoA reductase-like NADH-dependent reductase (Old Yellow Enzyme family)